MFIKVTENISLELIDENHSVAIFEMIDQNRAYLRNTLTFIDYLQSLESASAFVKGSMQRNQQGIEYGFVIVENGKAIGRIGIYKIDNYNRIGEIGYWLVENAQGKGTVSKCCQKLLEFCFSDLTLNRIEIKCGAANYKSAAIPERLNFKKEAVLKQAELLNGKFIDLNLYALLREETS